VLRLQVSAARVLGAALFVVTNLFRVVVKRDSDRRRHRPHEKRLGWTLASSYWIERTLIPCLRRAGRATRRLNRKGEAYALSLRSVLWQTLFAVALLSCLPSSLISRALRLMTDPNRGAA
jgi:hypothetical protein